jgi:osmoprotectant transport system permease protein
MRLSTRAALLGLASVGFAWVLGRADLWRGFLAAVFPGRPDVLYPGSLAGFAADHLRLVGASSGLAILIGVTAGVLLTRWGGRPFLPLASDVVALGQTFPPVAVIALAFPALGFGFLPSLLALSLYGLLPIVRNTVAGLEGVPADVIDAAKGMGMGPWTIFARVEAPLAVRVIIAGIRTSATINVGTAAIAATIGAGGLGVPIVGGLATLNPAFVLEGALAAAVLALLVDAALRLAETAALPAGLR